MSKRNGAQLELSKKGSMMHYKQLATPIYCWPHAGVCRLLYDLAHHNVFMMSTESYKVTKPNDRHFIGLENFVKIFTMIRFS